MNIDSQHTAQDTADAATNDAPAAQTPSAYSKDNIAELPVLEAIEFVGNTLGPFFTEDPRTGSAAAVFETLAALDVEEAAHEWPFVDDDIAREALTDMQAALAADNEEREDISWEYRRLFVGPQKKVAPPWGSVYTDYDTVIFGASTLALRQWVRAHVVVEGTDHKTPEDHIGLMLEQMAWIAKNRPELLEEYLRDHLLTWSSHFLTIVENETESSFYRGLACLTRESLEGIQQRLNISVEYPRYYR